MSNNAEKQSHGQLMATQIRKLIAKHGEIPLKDVGNFILLFDKRHPKCGLVHQIAIYLCTNDDVETISILMRGTEALLDRMEDGQAIVERIAEAEESGTRNLLKLVDNGDER